ncbi:MAG: acyltransferase, partial [Spirochaetia bacterium]
PFWLCLNHSDYRRKEAEDLTRIQLERAVKGWTDNKGMSFTLERNGNLMDTPNLKYTEQWLGAIYFLADILGG